MNRLIKSPFPLLILITTILYLLLGSSQDQIVGTHRTRMLNQCSGSRKLLEVLRKASMSSRTVIVTMVDKSWASPGSVLDVFMESLEVGDRTKHLLNHLVVVALDSQAFQYCQSIHPYCFHFHHKSTETGKPLNGTNYSALNKIRIEVLLQILLFGYNLVYTDADVSWLRDPFPLFDGIKDLTIGCDFYSSNQSNKTEKTSGGFYFMKSDMEMIRFFKLWKFSAVLYPYMYNHSMCEVIMQGDIVSVVELGIKFLEREYYGGFCQPSRDTSKIYTMHGNCYGDAESKVHSLRHVLNDSRR